VVRSGPVADLPCPVQDEIVVDQVDPQVIGIPATDVLVESEDFSRGFGQAIPAEEHVSVDVIGAEEVTHSASADVRGTLTPRPPALGVAVTRVWLERDWPEFVKAHHDPVGWADTVQRHDADGLLLELRIGTTLPGSRALKGDVLLAQDAAQ